MLAICAFVLIIILAVNILSELKAAERSEKQRSEVPVPLSREKSSAVYDWNKEKADTPSIIAFEYIARERRRLEFERRALSDICFLDACANFGEGPAKREDKIILFSDIKNV